MCMYGRVGGGFVQGYGYVYGAARGMLGVVYIWGLWEQGVGFVGCERGWEVGTPTLRPWCSSRWRHSGHSVGHS